MLESRKRKLIDNTFNFIVYLSALLSIILVAFIILYVFVKGISVINWKFLTTVTSALKGTKGIAGNIVNTLIIIFLTMLVALPIGIGSAVYLNEYAKNSKMVSFVEYSTEILTGIPSIVFGLFGSVFFGETLHLGYSLLTGTLTLVLMVLPLIIRNTQEALKTVPQSYRQGAIGLGSEKWHMIRTILIPCATPGIITGTMLAIGRIVGESAALLFTAGSSKLLPRNLLGWLNKPFQSGGTLTVGMYLSATSEGDFKTAFGIAVVLIVIVLLINVSTKVITRRFDVVKGSK